MLATGIQHALKLVDQLAEGTAPDIPALACKIVISLAEQIRALQARIGALEEDMKAWFRGNELAKRLKTIPGIGFITASALAASVTDPHQFTSGRQFAASLGLTPKADCSGAKERMGRISKMGDRYLRRLLVSGMTSQIQAASAQAGRSPLGPPPVGQQAQQAGCRRHGQQSRAGRLGRHDPRRGIPRASSHNRGNRMTV